MDFLSISIVCLIVSVLLGASVLNRMRIDARSGDPSKYMGYDEDEIPVGGTYFIVFLITLVGLGGAIWGGYSLCGTVRAMTVGERHTASIVSHESHRHYDSDKGREITESYPIIGFYAESGERITRKLRFASESTSYQRSFTVYYDPWLDCVVTIESGTVIWRSIIGGVTFMVFLLFMSLVFYGQGWATFRYKSLLKKFSYKFLVPFIVGVIAISLLYNLTDQSGSSLSDKFSTLFRLIFLGVIVFFYYKIKKMFKGKLK